MGWSFAYRQYGPAADLAQRPAPRDSLARTDVGRMRHVRPMTASMDEEAPAIRNWSPWVGPGERGGLFADHLSMARTRVARLLLPFVTIRDQAGRRVPESTPESTHDSGLEAAEAAVDRVLAGRHFRRDPRFGRGQCHVDALCSVVAEFKRRSLEYGAWVRIVACPDEGPIDRRA